MMECGRRSVMAILIVLAAVLPPAPVEAQVRIHDPVVRLLAKPYGIEKRIRLASVDDVAFGPGGSGRLTLSLENSGVKQVTLENPDFRLEVLGDGGKWLDLGRLRVPSILFPVTGADGSVKRRYVVDFRPALDGGETVRRLRSAAAEKRRFRLVGHSGLRVKLDADSDFHRERLKLELAGTMELGRGFSPSWERREQSLPAVGHRE